MTREMKQIFTRRITQANRTQLLVIMYEMILTYLRDAANAHKNGDMEEFKRSLGFARDCIAELRKNLNFEYDLSKTLFSIYAFADKALASCIYGNKTVNLDKIMDLFIKLHDAYHTVSKDDHSEPLMMNAQNVYAGYTYGRTDVNESLMDYGMARGYCV